jgi:hypothetical protein
LTEDSDDDYRRLPGLYRCWDLQFLLSEGTDYRIDYAELTKDGTPLFAVYAVIRTDLPGQATGRPQ